MVTITYVDSNGTEYKVDVADGETLMTAAVANGVPGIDGDCGGCCACATCHIYVTPELAAQTTEIEKDILSIADDIRDSSRLGCQIKITEALDGLVVEIPSSQH